MQGRISGRCSVHSVLDQLQLADEASLLDLRPTNWCDVSGLVTLACLCQRAAEAGVHVALMAPSNFDVAAYMARMRLGSVLDSLDVQHDLPEVREHEVGSLFELTEFDGASGATELAHMAYDHVLARDPAAASVLLSGIGETAENVSEHAGRQSGFAAAQRYRDGRLSFAVGDSGRGMLGSLASHGASTAEQAIRIGVRRGGTGSGDIGRGNGLPDVIYKVCETGGVVSIASGDSRVTLRSHGLRATTSSVAFPGTLIDGELRRLD